MGNHFQKANPKPNNDLYPVPLELWPYYNSINNPEILDWKRNLSEEEILKQASIQQDLPVRIIGCLYISDANTARNKLNRIKELGITHILNVGGISARGPSKEYERLGIKYKEINAQDEEDYDMLGLHLEECESFIKGAEESGTNCLIHCE